MAEEEDSLEELRSRVNRLETAVFHDEVETNKKLSAAEFLSDFDLSTHQERALLMGYFLENHEGVESFLPGDLEEAFERAKRKPPGNIHQVIARLSKKGFLMEAGKDGRATTWELTHTGEAEVEKRK